MIKPLSVVKKYPEFAGGPMLAFGGLAWLWAGAWVVELVGISDDFALGLAGFVSYILLWILPSGGLFMFACIEINKGWQQRMRMQASESPPL